MKILSLFSILFALVAFTFTFAGSPVDDSAVKQTITNYLSGIDSRNTEAVEQSLYSDATVLTVNTISDKTSRLSAGDIVSQLKKGTLGGWKREVNFSSVDVNDKTAIAKVEITAAKVKQISYVSLLNDNGKWKIVSDVSIISKNGE
jgi:hypothetical protein